MLAQEEARRLGHNFVGTEQLLLGLIGESTGIAAKVLKSMGVNLKDARVEVEKIIGRGSGFVAVSGSSTPDMCPLLMLFTLCGCSCALTTPLPLLPLLLPTRLRSRSLHVPSVCWRCHWRRPASWVGGCVAHHVHDNQLIDAPELPGST
jgi:ATP-dependent Clp protease ATP-binding subunit ClpC